MAVTKLSLFVATVLIVSTAGHEFFSSTDKILRLVKQQKKLLKDFSSYISDDKEALKTFKGSLQNLKLFSKNPELNAGNSAAVYKLFRQLRTLWISAIKYSERSFNEEFEKWLYSVKIPSQKDLRRATLGLIRLQEIYKLHPVNITIGMFPSADEAHYVGSVAYQEKKFHLAFHWFFIGFVLVKETKPIDSFQRVTERQLLQDLAYAAYHFGAVPTAVHFYMNLSRLGPTDDMFKNELGGFCGTLQRLSNFSYPDIYTFTVNGSGDPNEALCRGDVDQRTLRRQRALSCSYSTGGGNPRLMLAPVKEEVIWDEPRIIRYYDIITDKEIEILKNLSRPLLSRSKVSGGKDGKGVSDICVSQSVFLSEDDIVVSRVNQRIADITGLSLETDEDLYVENYGIAGECKPHYDTGNNTNDRIATFLIYLSDVKTGGATVFPKVGVSVQPIKGSAVFWYNLLKNGDEDVNTLHADCPVFVGNKWVAYKWIHEFGQEFTRPCSVSEWE